MKAHLQKSRHTVKALSIFAAIGLANLGGVVINPTLAQAETTECTQIVSLPAIITVQGIYCFKTNLVTSIDSGNAIDIQTNNVTIDMNGFKLGGSTAGTGTATIGIYANNRKNITIRNGNIRGFKEGIFIEGSSGSGHLIEDIRADGNRLIGLDVEGDNNIIRNNHVINTGGGSGTIAHGIVAIGASNTLIAENVVSGIFETVSSRGIAIIGSTSVEIRDNSIFDIKDATTKTGIYISVSSEVTVRNNQITNSTGTVGTTGILDDSGSTKVGCIDNETINYTTETSGCDYISGHQSL